MGNLGTANVLSSAEAARVRAACLPTAAGEGHMAQRRVLHVQRFPDQAQRIWPL